MQLCLAGCAAKERGRFSRIGLYAHRTRPPILFSSRVRNDASDAVVWRASTSDKAACALSRRWRMTVRLTFGASRRPTKIGSDGRTDRSSWLLPSKLVRGHDLAADHAVKSCLLRVSKLQQKNRDWMRTDLLVNPGQFGMVS